MKIDIYQYFFYKERSPCKKQRLAKRNTIKFYQMPKYIAIYCLALRRQLKSHLSARGSIS